jgi:hypothetical protein
VHSWLLCDQKIKEPREYIIEQRDKNKDLKNWKLKIEMEIVPKKIKI